VKGAIVVLFVDAENECRLGIVLIGVDGGRLTRGAGARNSLTIPLLLIVASEFLLGNLI